MASPKGGTEKTCNECECVISGKTRAVSCGFCENLYCFRCSKLKQAIFNELPRDPSLNFTCAHCRNTMPSIKRLLATVVSMEERISKLERQRPAEGQCDRETIREIMREEKEEEKDMELRKLNVIFHSLPESKKPSNEEKNVEDCNKVHEIISDIFQLNLHYDEVIRLGKANESRQKARPVRITVRNFEEKRLLLEASRGLQNHDVYSSVFITPDLTPKQRKEAFELREERRRRERNGEKDLVIRKGRIVQKQAGKKPNDHAYASGWSQGGRRNSSSSVNGEGGDSFL